MLHQIIVPVAPPRIPRTTLMTAAALSVEHCAYLTLLYVDEDNEGFFAPLKTLVPDEKRKGVVRFLGDVAAVVSEYGATADTKIVRGRNIAAAIKSAANHIHADAIVMTDGSVTRVVLGEVSVPVLVIHELVTSQSRPVTKDLAS